MRTLRKLRSRAKPSLARLISAVFPRYFLLLTTGDRLLLNSGGRLILKNPHPTTSSALRQRDADQIRDRAGSTIHARS